MSPAAGRCRSGWLTALAAVAWMAPVSAQTVPDIVYATVGPTTLRLDLYLPAPSGTPTPLVLWVHGGGWCAGARAPLPEHASALTAQGVAVASITYRLTSTTPNCANGAGATWPAQIHDLKGAVRFLRANAATWNLDPARFAAWGQSAGAHLAVTLALSPADPALEGTVGGNLAQSSSVSAVVAYFPPTDLLNLGPDFAANPPNLPAFVAVADGPGQPHANLIGFGAAGEGLGVLRANAGNPNPPWPQRLATARSASPVAWVSIDDPPVFLVHGSADPVVPVQQARRLRDALAAAGVDLVYREEPGLGHVPPAGDVSELARQWLRTRLAGDAMFGNGFE